MDQDDEKLSKNGSKYVLKKSGVREKIIIIKYMCVRAKIEGPMVFLLNNKNYLNI